MFLVRSRSHARVFPETSFDSAEADEAGYSDEDGAAEDKAGKLRKMIKGKERGTAFKKEMQALRVQIDEYKMTIAEVQEVLNMRDLEHGRTLLLFAASCGDKVSVQVLVDFMNNQKALKPVLIKDLRGSDIHGAPLLFQAVRGGDIGCFDVLRTEIGDTLGKGEVNDQLCARDKMKRTIIMCVADSDNDSPKMFEHLTRVLKDVKSRESEASRQPASTHHWYLRYKDDKDMTLLHLVARFGKKETFEAVLGAYRDPTNRSLFEEHLNAPDKKGRTPLMHLLRNKFNYKNNNSDEHTEGMLNKLGAILSEGDLEKQLKDSWETEDKKDAPTGLMHAARGGRATFKWALSKLSTETRSVRLNDVLPTSGSYDKSMGMLLAEAASGGDIEVLHNVVWAIETGKINIGEGPRRCLASWECNEEKRDDDMPTDEVGSRDRNERRARVKKAIESVNQYTGFRRKAQNIFKHAIMSRRIVAVEYVKRLIVEHFNHEEVWNLVSGLDNSEMNCLTYAASAEDSSNERTAAKHHHGSVDAESGEPPSCVSDPSWGDTPCQDWSNSRNPNLRNNEEVFAAVFKAVEEAAQKNFPEAEYRAKRLESLFVISPETIGLSPLAGAVFRQNKKMVDIVYKAYQTLCNTYRTPGWDVQKIMDQIPDEWTDPSAEERVLYEMASSDGEPNVSPSMLAKIEEVLSRVHRENNGPGTSLDRLKKDKRKMARWIDRLVQVAAERGAFKDIRSITSERFSLQAVMPALLEKIGDSEENTIEIVMRAVSGNSNPFSLGAVASRYIRAAKSDYPMYEHSLHLLQGRIDCLMNEILKALPQTVRGMGMVFGAHQSELHVMPFPAEEWERGRWADRLGFVVVQWMLEPSTVKDMIRNNDSGGSNMGNLSAQGLERVDDPLQSALDRGSDALAFTNSPLVRDFMHVKFSRSVPPWGSRSPFHHNIQKIFFEYVMKDEQDERRSERATRNSQGNHVRTSRTECMKDAKKRFNNGSNFLLRFLQGWDEDIQKTPGMQQTISGIPHRTLLPALQFTLAGIVGKPAIFYDVPAVRFAYGILSHTTMLGFFCSCIYLESEDSIPLREIIFYIFIAGLLWRELVEIGELIPPHGPVSTLVDRPRKKGQRSRRRQRLLPRSRVASALKRYLFFDSWNILDTSTIVNALAALACRLIARFPDEVSSALDTFGIPYSPDAREGVFFAAQWFLVISAPLLFSRLLFLSQIDRTLGPISQIIWKMLSLFMRFSLFVIVIMFSFAVAFYVFFFTCYEHDELVQGGYGTVERSMLTLFFAMLGDFDIDVLLMARDTCERPTWTNGASVGLMILYLVIMSILLLNLLIAILSTAHAEVHQQDKDEFHLARSRAIQQNWLAVQDDRLTIPLNLLRPILGTTVDLFYNIFFAFSWLRACGLNPPKYWPWSQELVWKRTILGSLHRLVFACTMGLFALAASAVLWVISIPLMGWRYFCWIVRWDEEEDEDAAWYNKGYFNSLVVGFFKMLSWLVSVAFSSIICVLSLSGLIVLWVRGLIQVFEWLQEQLKHTTSLRGNNVPGPLELDLDEAWKMARMLNEGPVLRVWRMVRLVTGENMKTVSARAKRVHNEKREGIGRTKHEEIMASLDEIRQKQRSLEKRGAKWFLG